MAPIRHPRCACPRYFCRQIQGGTVFLGCNYLLRVFVSCGTNKHWESSDNESRTVWCPLAGCVVFTLAPPMQMCFGFVVSQGRNPTIDAVHFCHLLRCLLGFCLSHHTRKKRIFLFLSQKQSWDLCAKVHEVHVVSPLWRRINWVGRLAR